MKPTWFFAAMPVLPIVALGGCGTLADASLGPFVPFVPILRADTGELYESPGTMEQQDFRLGLPIILVEYGHEFVWTPDGVKVRKFMHKKGASAGANPGRSPLSAEDEELDYRANMTKKGMNVGHLYNEAKRGWGWP